MDSANSTLMNEVALIMREPEKAVHFYWECIIQAGPNRVVPLKLLNIDIVRDYAGAYADEIMVQVALGGGTFSQNVVPYKEALKLTLYKHPISQSDTLTDNTRGVAMQEFRATLTDVPGDKIAPSSAQINNVEAGDLSSFRTITFQLQDLSLEQIRFITLGTAMRRCTAAEVLRALFTQASKSINVDEQNKIKGVTMVAEHNTEAREHIVIPHGTPLVKLPDFLQNEAGGIYSAGLGFYLQKDMWYVWPLFDLSRFDTSPKTLTVIVLPDRRLDSIERTYRTTANQVIILITGGAVHGDNSEQVLANEGNGARFADSRKIMEGFGEVKNNVVVAKRSYNNNEFVGVTRGSGINNVPMTGITNNVFAQASRISRRKGALLTVNWQNSDPDLLRPDVPVQVIYPDNEGLPVTLNATLMQAHTYVSSAEVGLANRRHLTNTAITLFVEKDLPELKEYQATQTTTGVSPALGL